MHAHGQHAEERVVGGGDMGREKRGIVLRMRVFVHRFKNFWPS